MSKIAAGSHPSRLNRAHNDTKVDNWSSSGCANPLVCLEEQDCALRFSNAGFWAVGRLQTDADRERIVESLTNIHEARCTPKELDATIRKLNQRWFLTRNVHQSPSITLVQPRWALSYMRGPMTLGDIKRALGR